MQRCRGLAAFYDQHKAGVTWDWQTWGGLGSWLGPRVIGAFGVCCGDIEGSSLNGLHEVVGSPDVYINAWDGCAWIG